MGKVKRVLSVMGGAAKATGMGVGRACRATASMVSTVVLSLLLVALGAVGSYVNHDVLATYLPTVRLEVSEEVPGPVLEVPEPTTSITPDPVILEAEIVIEAAPSAVGIAVFEDGRYLIYSHPKNLFDMIKMAPLYIIVFKMEYGVDGAYGIKGKVALDMPDGVRTIPYRLRGATSYTLTITRIRDIPKIKKSPSASDNDEF